MSTEPKVDTESGFFRIIIVGGLVIAVLVLFAICVGVGYVVLRGFSSGTGGPAQDAALEKEPRPWPGLPHRRPRRQCPGRLPEDEQTFSLDGADEQLPRPGRPAELAATL